MKILLLCNKSPYPAHEGGPMAMSSIINGLLDAGHQVKVIAVNSEKFNVNQADIPQDLLDKTGIELIDLDLRIIPKEAFKSLLKNESYHVKRFVSADFAKAIDRVLKKEQFDVVQLETVFMAPYIAQVRSLSNATIVLRAHNVEHLIWKRVAGKSTFLPKKWYLTQLSNTLKKYELDMLEKVDGIAAITRKDAAYFRGLTATPVIDIPYGIKPEGFVPSFAVPANPTFFHIGSMNWIPNQDGIKWFLETTWPRLKAQLPEAQFYLAGRFMPEWLVGYQAEGVHIVGEVDDALQFVAANHIAIVPLLSGSGIRIKIIEAMAMGKTVITTKVGAEGIGYTEGENIFIADKPEKFIEYMKMLAGQPERAEKTGRAARKLIEEIYDNRKIVSRLLKFYGELQRQKIGH